MLLFCSVTAMQCYCYVTAIYNEDCILGSGLLLLPSLPVAAAISTTTTTMYIYVVLYIFERSSTNESAKTNAWLS